MNFGFCRHLGVIEQLWGRLEQDIDSAPVAAENFLVVGGSSGIGLATARLLCERGGAVVIASRSRARLDAAQAVEPRLTPRILDAANDLDVQRFFDATRDRPLDGLVVTPAGGAALGPFATIDDARFRAALEIKLWAYLNVLRHAIPHLAEHASITFVTGASAGRASPGSSSLVAANGAIEALVPTLAVELAPMRVNAVAPGLVDTPAWERIPPERLTAMFDAAKARTPLRRVGPARDIAAAIVALIDNDFITGTVLRCDGGLGIA